MILMLKAKLNRVVNIVVGVFHMVVLLTTLLVPGDTWGYYIYYMSVEAVLMALIIWHAWKWPVEAAGTAPADG